MDYREARELLDRLPRLEAKPGLSRTRRLLEVLGHPERGYPAVHIAGTNGKGSVAAMLASVLQRAGYSVGRFTSPELIDFRDRIVVNGEWIGEADLAALTERIGDALFESADVPTLFEALTAVALQHFAEQAVDVAVVEVGLGGRFDATNLVCPVLSVLTNVALDHVGILGESVEQIAWEKAGIARSGVPIVVGPLSLEAERVVLDECARVGAALSRTRDGEVVRESANWRAARYQVRSAGLPRELELPLVGGYQIDNLRVTLRAIEVLRERGLHIPEKAVLLGLAAVTWPGRFEVFGRSPTIVLEGAHNVAGARSLVADLEIFVPQAKRRCLVLGVLRDKDVVGMVRTLVPAFPRVAVCQSNSPRALPAGVLHGHVAAFPASSACYDSVEQALEACVASSGSEDVVVVAGSLTVVSEARRRLVEGS